MKQNHISREPYNLIQTQDRIYLTRANIYLAKKNYEKVRESIEKALAINPANEAAYRALIIYWLSGNNLDEAEKFLT